jgi:polysaccharide export outer membrane protein
MKSRAISLILSLFLTVGTGVSYAQQNWETAAETNARLRQLAASAHARSGDYQIGSGDLLRIDVFDVPELSREVRVSDSGSISLPLIPIKVRAAGLTPFQLEEKLCELLQVNGLVSKPQVTVFVKEHQSQPITVIGAVRNPRVYQAVRQTTLLEILSLAGGLADDAGSVVIITRAPAPATGEADAPPAGAAAEPPSVTINLKDLLSSGDSQFNVPVYGGDVVSVPRAGIVYAVGAVERPGGFALTSDNEELSVLQALALAGGLTRTARAGNAVIIRKKNEAGDRQEIAVNLKKIMDGKEQDVRLRPNDILFVPDSAAKRALRRAADAALSITGGVVILRGGT